MRTGMDTPSMGNTRMRMRMRMVIMAMRVRTRMHNIILDVANTPREQKMPVFVIPKNNDELFLPRPDLAAKGVLTAIPTGLEATTKRH